MPSKVIFTVALTRNISDGSKKQCLQSKASVVWWDGRERGDMKAKNNCLHCVYFDVMMCVVFIIVSFAFLLIRSSCYTWVHLMCVYTLCFFFFIFICADIFLVRHSAIPSGISILFNFNFFLLF